ncbi:hypothetical protein F4821DRAFT_245003 [Hypoxylon rubiginosum]|uniref:Uncharacterized protein n=1 Tax=Hypoxylon rubiginosum TaxID=110542 RepID=A0ACC0CSB1_9PEZI|nr:hypothetical protein F4821DRAFT_245003 [Hypoxylon rubiginosum]
MPSQPPNTSSSFLPEDRKLFGLGPDRRMPYSCTYCLGTPRLVKGCRPCNGTGLMWDSSQDSIYQGKDERQMTSGGPSPGSSSVPSYTQRG